MITFPPSFCEYTNLTCRQSLQCWGAMHPAILPCVRAVMSVTVANICATILLRYIATVLPTKRNLFTYQVNLLVISCVVTVNSQVTLVTLNTE